MIAQQYSLEASASRKLLSRRFHRSTSKLRSPVTAKVIGASSTKPITQRMTWRLKRATACFRSIDPKQGQGST